MIPQNSDLTRPEIGWKSSCTWKWEIVGKNLSLSENCKAILNLKSGASLYALRKVHPRDRLRLLRLLRCFIESDAFSTHYTFRWCHSEKPVCWIRMSCMAVRSSNHGIEYLHGTLEDVTDQLRCDPLTGLYNKDSFIEMIRMKAEAANPDYLPVLIFFGIDRLEEIEDVFSVSVLERVLIKISQKLKSAFGKDDILSRLDRSTFAAITTLSKSDVPLVCETIFNAFKQPLKTINAQSIYIDIHMGAVSLESNHILPTEYVSHGYCALNHAKRSSKTDFVHFYNSDSNIKLSKKVKLEFELRDAIQNSLLSVVFQPIVDLRLRRPISFEALVRWNHPVAGLLSPSKFIPLAEEMQIVDKIDRFVFETSCYELSRLNELGHTLYVSINTSRRILENQNNLEFIVNCINRYRIHPKQIQIEVTETAFFHDLGLIKKFLLKIREIGVRIAVDDFGTGFSSLSYLVDLPVTAIKIDRSFLRNVDTNLRRRTLLISIIRMASDLGLDSICEGVETQFQFNLLKAAFCGSIQGYYISKPVNVQDLHDFLNKSLDDSYFKTLATNRSLVDR